MGKDGLLSAWGRDDTGSLGTGSTLVQRLPVVVPTPSLPTVTKLYAGLYASYLWGPQQSIYGFGYTYPWFGAPRMSSSPTVQPEIAGFSKVSDGATFNLALKPDGTLWSVGSNSYGELGNGSISPNSTTSLHQILSLTNVKNCSAAGAGYFSLALKGDGTVWSWGDDSNGQLGLGNYTSVMPIPQKINISNVVDIASGYGTGLALKSDGTVWNWGYTIDGLTSYAVPTQVTGLSSITSITTVDFLCVALKSDGTVWAIGDFWDSRSDLWYDTPTQIPGLTSITAISSGDGHLLALRSDGTVWTFGLNLHGQLGNSGTEPQFTTAIQVPGLHGITLISAGWYHNLAWGNGTLYSWGLDWYGGLGIGRKVIALSPDPLTAITWN